MKKLQLSLFSWLLCVITFAQTSGYKNILEERSSVSQDEFYQKLKSFQKKNTQFSSVYFQIGAIDLGHFSSIDPIVNRGGSRQFIHNAKINFGLSKGFYDAGDAIKNPNWYNLQKIKNKDSLSSMINDLMDSQYEAVVAYATSYEKLVKHYDLAVAHYLLARQEFIDINNSANSLRELFLLADDSLKLAVQEIGQNFDSCIYHLDIYRATYQDLPHSKKRKSKVTLQKINHFRMNGITPSNFLAEDINLWDYGEWSKHFTALLKEEVDGLRDEISEAYAFFLKTNELMMNSDECIQATVDDLKLQRIINLITKYDNQSVLIDVFSYISNKLEYGNQLVFEKNCNIIESLPTDNLLSRKVRTFQTIYNELIKSDSSCQVITTSTKTQENFTWFYNKYMPGSNGSADFSQQQIIENNKAFTTEINHFRALIDQQYMRIDSVEDCYQLQESLLIANPTNPNGESICIIKKLALVDSLSLGIMLKGEAQSIAGLIEDDADYVLAWEYPLKSPIEFFKILTDSSFIYGGRSGKTWLKHVALNGSEKANITLKTGEPIQNVHYNDLQGIYTIISGVHNEESNMGYTISKVGFNGKTSATKNITITGKFINLFVTDQQYWIFSESQGNVGTLISANILTSDFEPNQEVPTLHYNFINDLLAPLVIKNDDKTITIIASSLANESELIYALIDYQGNIQHEKKY